MVVDTFSGVSAGAEAGGGIAVSTTRRRAVKMRSAGFCVHVAAAKPLVELIGGIL